MFKKILIANRGEIALRIIRTCREMEIDTVAVYSTADKEELHVQLAGEAVCIGPAAASESYLNMKNILEAAISTGCDAIHPGFGFLSENSVFADLCRQCGITFIGPSSEVIKAMGNKSAARKLMQENHVPVVPGSEGSVQSVEEAYREAKRIGYPVLIKAAAGGGGRGMRVAQNEEELENAYLTARAETRACFHDEEMYIEKWILHPKHVEFQILADAYGSVIHLGERDCSVQRKHQKMIEESPCCSIDKDLWTQMGETAVRAAKAADYVNAGTVEFILDSENHFYFIEMNTRIQVEHGVTEMLTGVDLIREQIRIAAGLNLSYRQEDIKRQGHVIECRINAENPQENFRPSPGTVNFIHLPGGCGVRVDTAMYQGYTVSPFYDSMIAKILVCGNTRLEAIRRMRRALQETIIEGIDTNIEFQHLLMYRGEFVRGNYNTGFLEEQNESVSEKARESDYIKVGA